jgi:hypothetical protein
MDDATPGMPAAPPAPASSRPRQRPGAGTLLTFVNGVLTGVGGVYIGMHSVPITVVAGIMAIMLAAMVPIFAWGADGPGTDLAAARRKERIRHQSPVRHAF